MYSLTAWILVTLFRFDIFYNIFTIIIEATKNTDLLAVSIHGPPNRLMIFMSQFTPLFIIVFIQFLVLFFSNDHSPAEVDEVDEQISTNFGNDAEFRSVRGSINDRNAMLAKFDEMKDVENYKV